MVILSELESEMALYVHTIREYTSQDSKNWHMKAVFSHLKKQTKLTKK